MGRWKWMSWILVGAFGCADKNPNALVSEPDHGTAFNEGDLITFTGNVDTFDPTGAEVAWSSHVSDLLHETTTWGEHSFEMVLPPGAHTITLAATDRRGEASHEIEIVVNDLPSEPGIEIRGGLPGLDLEAVVKTPSEDMEGDAITYSYSWMQDGVFYGSGKTVPGEEVQRGETWAVVVTPSDDGGVGDAASAEVLVGNHPPIVQRAEVEPADPRAGDTIGCFYLTPFDRDGDQTDVTIGWFVNGERVAHIGAELPQDYWGKGDEVACGVFATDGRSYGQETTSAPVIIGNAAPAEPVITLLPSPVVAEMSDLRCAFQDVTTDIDGDALTYSISWFADGLPFGSATTTDEPGDTITALDLVQADRWTCTVTANDGEDRAQASASIDPIPLENYGNDVEMVDNSGHLEDYALGFAVEVNQDLTLTHLAYIGKAATAQVRLGLYTDSGGLPGSLIVQSAVHTVATGHQELPVTPTDLTPGDYWIMGVYDSPASIGQEDGNDLIAYWAHDFDQPLPASASGVVTYRLYNYNYYLVGFPTP